MDLGETDKRIPDKWKWLLEGAWRGVRATWWWLDVFVRLLGWGVIFWLVWLATQ